MHLSKNFTLAELTSSATATRLSIDNTPTSAVINCLRSLTENILQPIRDRYGIPFSPNSGYRSRALNQAIGGSTTSDHMSGRAVDLKLPGVSNLDLALWIQNNLNFDQLILEFYTIGNPTSGWVHCSYRDIANRKEVLTAFKKNGHILYLNGLRK
jgi:zinc D-Ala-D-Ala carboxypeptidase